MSVSLRQSVLALSSIPTATLDECPRSSGQPLLPEA